MPIAEIKRKDTLHSNKFNMDEDRSHADKVRSAKLRKQQMKDRRKVARI